MPIHCRSSVCLQCGMGGLNDNFRPSDVSIGRRGRLECLLVSRLANVLRRELRRLWETWLLIAW
jgi:hypothetical protein